MHRTCVVGRGLTLGLGNEFRKALHADLALIVLLTSAQMMWHSSATAAIAAKRTRSPGTAVALLIILRSLRNGLSLRLLRGEATLDFLRHPTRTVTSTTCSCPKEKLDSFQIQSFEAFPIQQYFHVVLFFVRLVWLTHAWIFSSLCRYILSLTLVYFLCSSPL